MHFAKYVWVGEESAQAGFCAKDNSPPAMLGAGEKLRVGVAEDASAQGGEWFCFYDWVFDHGYLSLLNWFWLVKSSSSELLE